MGEQQWRRDEMLHDLATGVGTGVCIEDVIPTEVTTPPCRGESSSEGAEQPHFDQIFFLELRTSQGMQ
ncbi:unnamed protein product [Urochloa humidicola]